MSCYRKTPFRSTWLVLAMALLPAVADAAPQQDCLRLKSIQSSREVLRPGESYEVKLELESRSADCWVPTAMGRQPAPRLSVKLAPEPGLAAQWTSRSDDGFVDAHRFVVGLTLTLRVAALPKAAPGDHGIATVVSYDAEDCQGVLSGHELAFPVPVKVIPAGAPEQTQPSHPWDWLMLIPLVPFWFLKGIVDMITGNPEC